MCQQSDFSDCSSWRCWCPLTFVFPATLKSLLLCSVKISGKQSYCLINKFYFLIYCHHSVYLWDIFLIIVSFVLTLLSQRMSTLLVHSWKVTPSNICSCHSEMLKPYKFPPHQQLIFPRCYARNSPHPSRLLWLL